MTSVGTTTTTNNNKDKSVSFGPASTLVNVAEDAELRLVSLLASSASSASFAEDCERCVANAEAASLVRTVVRDEGAVGALFSTGLSGEDAAAATSLLAALLDRCDAEEGAAAAAEAADVVDAFRSADGDAARDRRRRATLLSALRNARPDPAERCRLTARVLAARPEAAEEAAVVATLERADGVPVEDRRALLRALADAHGDRNEDQRAKRQRRLLDLLRTYDDQQTRQHRAEAKEAAVQAVVGAVRDPVSLFADQRGMLSLPPVALLKEDQDTATLHELLRVFQEARLSDFQRFAKQHPDVLSAHGLDETECARHMRVLSLCSLAADHGDEIPYAAVAEALDVPEDGDVESWVIAAVASGLLEAKMDQLRKTVVVQRSVVRTFGPEQWRAVRARLDAWRRSVQAVLDGLADQQSPPLPTVQS